MSNLVKRLREGVPSAIYSGVRRYDVPAFERTAQEAADRIERLEEALRALVVWSRNGEQLCFRSHNGVPMGMSKLQERLARAALQDDKP